MSHEYLVSYGNNGDFGRFRPVRQLTCQRGVRAVVRSFRGVELGVVLCEATQGHAHFLPNTSLGQLLRLATAEDEQTAELMRERGQQMFERGRRLASDLSLPLEILDVEVLLDGQQAVVHYLPFAECDERPLVSQLSREHELHVALHNMAMPKEEEEHGCGRPDCGQKEGGGCDTCSSGGGCSSCGASKPNDMKEYFGGLRAKMMEGKRTPLL